MNDMFDAKEYKLRTKDVGQAVKEIQVAFQKKRELELAIANHIRKFEDETGLAIDVIKYQRDITIPIRGAKYTDLTIIITSEEGLNAKR